MFVSVAASDGGTLSVSTYQPESVVRGWIDAIQWTDSPVNTNMRHATIKIGEVKFQITCFKDKEDSNEG